ncbi:MAG: hypothetical protein R3300_07100 [Candidatus Promineifilaceae bacterium]|nr:hypothetical protein [Candidatus Promineifilaceae bacterium]
MSARQSRGRKPKDDRPERVRFPTPVNRLRIRVADGEWSVEKQVDIPSMTLRGSAPRPTARKGFGRSGFWVDAVDAQGRVIYRAKQRNPFRRTVELFETSGEMQRKDSKREQALFDVLIPDRSDIVELRFYSSFSPDGQRLSDAELIHTLRRGRDKKEGGRYGD